MKKIFRSAGFACLMAATTLAQATTYDFSYTLLDSSTIVGRFDGDAIGNLITNLSHISVSVNGAAFINNGNLYSTSAATPLAAEAVMSFDGTANDFVFTDAPLLSGTLKDILIGSYAGGYPFINYNTSSAGANGEGGDGSDDVQAFRPNAWSVSAVPEPATYAMLLAGLGLLGVMARRRRNAAA